MPYPTLRELYRTGAIALLHDYRSGHCASLLPDSVPDYRDGTPTQPTPGAGCRFRTGHGFETCHNGATPALSQGYIRIPDAACFYPPADGMVIVASYLQDSDDQGCTIVGQGDATVAATSWILNRRSTHIDFTTSDNVATSTFAYAIAASPGDIETIGVKYNGGVGANNCIIGRSLNGAAWTTTTGQITRVPQNAAQPVSVGCYSTSAQYPFHGTMRWVIVIRGKQTLAIMLAAVSEIEALQWSRPLHAGMHNYLVAARETQYVSDFGVDRSVAEEVGTDYARISNSNWHARELNVGNPTNYIVRTAHTGNYGDVGSTNKTLEAIDNGFDNIVYMPRADYWRGTATESAYGTWDFLYCFADPGSIDPEMSIWPVASTNDLTGNGYYLTRLSNEAMRLIRMPGNTAVATSAAGLVGAGWYRIRITRDGAGVWNVYLNNNYLAGWSRIIGPVTDNTHGVSDYVLLMHGQVGEILSIDSNVGGGTFFKWVGVVAPV